MKKSIHSKSAHVLIHYLRELRESKGLTQSDLANKIDSDQTFISKIETGERRVDILELRSICSALHISLSEFVAELEERLKL